MYKASFRGILVVLALALCVAGTQAQRYGSALPRRPSGELQGTWYNAGDPARPVYIDVAPGGRMAILTDEVGMKARGRVTGPGRVRVDVPGGTLDAEMDGGVLYWSDGSYWTR